jgi:DNA modification methylase
LSAILHNSLADDAIYEPFAGSGTAESTGRVCLAMEIDPRYCDVIVERWQRFTGKGAVLDGNGRAAA